jgi:hypothetical protein
VKSTPVAGEHTKSEKLAGGKVQTVASPLPLMASEGGARHRPHATSHTQKKHGKLCSAIGGYTTFHVQEAHAHTRTHTHAHTRTHTHAHTRTHTHARTHTATPRAEIEVLWEGLYLRQPKCSARWCLARHSTGRRAERCRSLSRCHAPKRGCLLEVTVAARSKTQCRMKEKAPGRGLPLGAGVGAHKVAVLATQGRADLAVITKVRVHRHTTQTKLTMPVQGRQERRPKAPTYFACATIKERSYHRGTLWSEC